MMPQLLVNIILSALAYLYVAISFATIERTLRFFHLAHAISLTLSCYLVYTVVVKWGIALWIAIPVAVFVSIALMLMVNEWIYKPLQKKGVANWQMMIVSLGLYVVLQNAVSMIWGDSTLSYRTWEIKTGHEFLGAYITDVQIVTIMTCVTLLVLTWLLMEKTNMGRQIKAVASNPELSTVLGVSKDKAVIWSMGIGTGLAAIAGILIAADYDMTPTMGFDWLLYAVVAMIISGMGKMRHLVMGALLLAVAQHLVAYYLDSKWMNAVAYVILIVFLFFRPSGFSGQQVKKSSI